MISLIAAGHVDYYKLTTYDWILIIVFGVLGYAIYKLWPVKPRDDKG
jgi:hypothetical protein